MDVFAVMNKDPRVSTGLSQMMRTLPRLALGAALGLALTSCTRSAVGSDEDEASTSPDTDSTDSGGLATSDDSPLTGTPPGDGDGDEPGGGVDTVTGDGDGDGDGDDESTNATTGDESADTTTGDGEGTCAALAEAFDSCSWPANWSPEQACADCEYPEQWDEPAAQCEHLLDSAEELWKLGCREQVDAWLFCVAQDCDQSEGCDAEMTQIHFYCP